MNKTEFLNQSTPFVEWLSAYLDNEIVNPGAEPFHQWVSRSKKAAPRAGYQWLCQSLFNAYDQYYWQTTNPLNGQNINTFAKSNDCLAQLQDQLQNAIKNGIGQECLDTCLNILRWGGVIQWKVAIVIRNIDKDLLPAYLDAIRTFLSKSDLQPTETFSFERDGKTYDLEVDSGTTKIYSLLVPGWIIYDGRVGAALGFLVNRWEQSENRKIPPALKFSWGYEQRRNPNIGRRRTFPRFGSKINRFEHNLYGNWLCEFILEKYPNCQFNLLKNTQPNRALEAALFMIGYCVRNEEADNLEDGEEDGEVVIPAMVHLDAKEIPFRVQQIIEKFGGKAKCEITQQKSTPFTAELTEAGIIVKKSLGSYPFLPWAVFHETVQLLERQGGQALRGNCQGKGITLGNVALPVNSVEGYVAQQIYGKKIGKTVFRRVSAIANILVWAGICLHERNYLVLV